MQGMYQVILARNSGACSRAGVDIRHEREKVPHVERAAEMNDVLSAPRA
jgi:hypothetical protein